jgi:hypothetical protein
MEFIEMIAWISIGFVPTLGVGNALLSCFDKTKGEKLIPWKI